MFVEANLRNLRNPWEQSVLHAVAHLSFFFSGFDVLYHDKPTYTTCGGHMCASHERKLLRCMGAHFVFHSYFSTEKTEKTCTSWTSTMISRPWVSFLLLLLFHLNVGLAPSVHGVDLNHDFNAQERVSYLYDMIFVRTMATLDDR